MRKCMCIGCNNIVNTEVKENETGDMLEVCEEHVETINQVKIAEYEGINRNTFMEFSIATLRMGLIISLNQKLSQSITEHYPSEAPEYLVEAYKKVENSFEHLIRAESKFLTDLE